jgi:hypothetical protein
MNARPVAPGRHPVDVIACEFGECADREAGAGDLQKCVRGFRTHIFVDETNLVHGHFSVFGSRKPQVRFCVWGFLLVVN